MNKFQKIKCNVESCDFNDCKQKECILDEILVSCDCNKDKVKEKSETICKSFKNTNEIE